MGAIRATRPVLVLTLFQEAAVIEDVNKLEIPHWRRKLFFQASGRRLSAKALFHRLVTEQQTNDWRGRVSYRGGSGTFALARNLIIT